MSVRAGIVRQARERVEDLPDPVASHFNFSGEPTSWMDKMVRRGMIRR